MTADPLFDAYVIVDWSARAVPSPKRPVADAIWWAVARRQGQRVSVEEPVYCRTRAAAIAALADLFAAELSAGRRILAGFDFPFGYPEGLAARVTGSPETLRLWQWLADAIEDGPNNANNRFEVAARINRLFDGVGPFWGCPVGRGIADLPMKGRARHGIDHPAERRIVEMRQRSAQPTWKLFTTGSVGGQILLGLPALERLRQDPRFVGRVEIWPFETGLAPPRGSAIAEIYPSLLDDAVAAQRWDGEIKDRAQVRVNAAAFARLDAAGGLAPLFAGSADLTACERDLVAREEAWILGVGHRDALRAAA
ncbi:MAG: molybdopterin guanine dinucleotide synthesis [Pseudomonadota bacterium]